MKDSIDRIEEEGYSVILKEFFKENPVTPPKLSRADDMCDSEKDKLLSYINSNNDDNKRQCCI